MSPVVALLLLTPRKRLYLRRGPIQTSPVPTNVSGHLHLHLFLTVPRAYNLDANCTFCLATGHDISECRTAQKVLSEHKRSAIRGLEPTPSTARGSSTSGQRYTKASKAQTVSLGPHSNDNEPLEEDASEHSPPPTRAAVASVRPKHYARSALVKKDHQQSKDWTIDSACSRTMTPSSDGVSLQTTDHTQISLADDSCISASHSGKVTLPILGSPLIDTPVVPKLHGPLLSVAELYNQGHLVLFMSKGCDVYTGTVVDLGAKVLG